MSSALWPPQGSGGGGGGNVTGPSSSVQYSIPIFADTTGKALIDAHANTFAYIPTGDNTDGGGQLGLVFNGNSVAASTGWKAIFDSGNSQTFIELFVGGTQYIAYGDGAVTFENVDIRPDSAFTNATSVGLHGNQFEAMYATYFLFGTSSRIRALFMGPQNGNDVNTVDTFGMGMDYNNRNEWYLELFDTTLTGFYPAFNVTLNNGQAILSAPINGPGGGNGISMVLQGVPSITGTGNGGDVLLNGGSTVGGTEGRVFIPSQAGAPTGTPNSYTGFVCLNFDSTNNKLYAYLNGSWKATAALT